MTKSDHLRQLDRVVDRVKPWLIVHGSVHGSRFGSWFGSWFYLWFMIHGSFLNLPLGANFYNSTDLSHTTTDFRTSTQPQLVNIL